MRSTTVEGIWPAYETFYDRGGKRSIFILEPAPAA
jgi:hypothetical protein